MKHPGTFSSIYAFSPCCMGDWDLRLDDAMKAAEAVTSPDQIRSAPPCSKVSGRGRRLVTRPE
jgi:hypothetical protein